jgi:hypothetical protein
MRTGSVRYPCPTAYTPNCDAKHCSHWGKPNCVDGYIQMELEAPGGRPVKYLCPRAYTSDCDAAHCSIWGSSKCVDGYVNSTIKL